MSLLVRPEPYTGVSPFNEFVDVFDKAAKVNKWTDGEKLDWMAVLIQGPAASAYNELTADQKVDFATLVLALRSKYEPPEKLALYKAQLKARKRMPGESISDLLNDVKEKVRLAYPSLTAEARSDIALDYFLDALKPESLRLSVRQSLPKTPDQAARNATTYEAIHLSENSSSERTGTIPPTSPQAPTHIKKESAHVEVDVVTQREDPVLQELRKLRAEVEHLKRSITPSTTQTTTPNQNLRKCYYCGKAGHIQRDCRKRQGNARGRR